jgi:hypothetical protein
VSYNSQLHQYRSFVALIVISKVVRPLLMKQSFLILLFALFISPAALAQTATPAKAPASDPKAEAIIAKGIEAVGGNAFLNVKTVVGRGFYTTFNQGMSQIPARFLDYIVFPDKERTEFSGGGIKTIQTNDGDTGWLYDGGPKAITDMKAPQIESFKRAMRTSFDNVLRGWWKKEGASLSYVGRREAGFVVCGPARGGFGPA